jgi:hypothetical protein
VRKWRRCEMGGTGHHDPHTSSQNTDRRSAGSNTSFLLVAATTRTPSQLSTPSISFNSVASTLVDTAARTDVCGRGDNGATRNGDGCHTHSERRRCRRCRACPRARPPHQGTRSPALRHELFEMLLCTSVTNRNAREDSRRAHKRKESDTAAATASHRIVFSASPRYTEKTSAPITPHGTTPHTSHATWYGRTRQDHDTTGSTPEREKKALPVADAAARTSVVLAQPGGPWSNTPRGVAMDMRRNAAACRSGHSTAWPGDAKSPRRRHDSSRRTRATSTRAHEHTHTKASGAVVCVVRHE